MILLQLYFTFIPTWNVPSLLMSCEKPYATITLTNPYAQKTLEAYIRKFRTIVFLAYVVVTLNFHFLVPFVTSMVIYFLYSYVYVLIVNFFTPSIEKVLMTLISHQRTMIKIYMVVDGLV